jgi:fructokinase
MFVVCGEALWDLYGTESASGLTFDARIGGSPFNVAVGLARLGQQAALLTGLSTDRLGRRLLARLEAEGVATTHVVRNDRPTTLSLVELADDGSPAYAFYGEGAADRAVGAADLPALGADVWGLHAGSFSLVAEPVGSSLLTFFERARNGRLLTLDPNVRLTAEPDLSLWRRRIDAFVRLSDLVKVSAEDLDLLHPGVPHAEIVAGWRQAGASLVIVTRGVAGAEAYGPFGRVETPGLPVEVVDTVGAGDSFMAAVAAGLAERGLRSRERLTCIAADEAAALLVFATAAAAVTCARRGADPPRRDEL